MGFFFRFSQTHSLRVSVRERSLLATDATKRKQPPKAAPSALLLTLSRNVFVFIKDLKALIRTTRNVFLFSPLTG